MRSYSLDSQAKNVPIKVLLVDDDQNTYLLTRRMLSKMQGPFQIEWAPSYESGFEAIKRKQHDVYLLDYRLGARNGLELLRQALAAGCKEPIIMLTTENPEVDTKAMKLGAADFLSKDHLDPALLERSIRYSIKQYATLRALRESEAQLASDITERKRLEKEIQEVSEQEKRRIGQDLHDGLGQYLTGISFMAKVLQQKLASKRLPEAAGAQKISELVNRTVSQTRDLARGLCPVELETNGLQAALLELAASVDKLFDDISCSLECSHPVSMNDNAAAIHLYRIAQEAVNNAIKHGKASQIVIGLLAGEGTIFLTVKDNGCGLPRGLSKSKGMGLRVMNYRAGMIGASVTLETATDGGTLVSCTMPNSRKSQKTPVKSPGSKRIPRASA